MGTGLLKKTINRYFSETDVDWYSIQLEHVEQSYSSNIVYSLNITQLDKYTISVNIFY